eukprot:jgi/Chrzof1/5065/Cz15g10150.t1
MSSSKNASKYPPKATSSKSINNVVKADVSTVEDAPVCRSAPRPTGAAEPQDANFTLEDESAVSAAEALMQSWCVTDPHLPGHPVVYVSPGFEATTGFSSQDIVGKSCRLLQGPKTEPEAVEVLSTAIREHSFACVEMTNNRKDGRTWRNVLCVVPLLDAAGRLVRWLGIQCDIDDKRKREHVDEHYVTRWAEQVKHHLGAFLITDSQEESCPVASTSGRTQDITGFNTNDLKGLSCLCLCGPETSTNKMRKLMIAQRSNQATMLKMLLYKQDGCPFWAYVFTCPLTLQSQQQVVAGGRPTLQLLLIIDVTTTRLKRIGKYVLGRVLGQGASGVVRMGRNTTTDELVAVKTVDATRFRSIGEIEQIQEEIAVLANLKHPNIIRLLEVHFVNSMFFFVMEWASGGSLVRHIYSQENHCFNEQEAKRVFLQIIAALDYCHRRRVIHRDLKPENILMDTANNVKVADFGLAAVMAPFSGSLTLQCGTPEFTAPEIVGGKEYEGPAVDLWSLGVMLYESLCGSLPFKGATQAALFKAIQRGTYVPLPPHVSPEAKDLVKRLLTVDPVQRITMPDILRHPWVNSAMGGLGGIAGPTGGTAVLPWPAWNDAQALPLDTSSSDRLLSEDCCIPSGSNSSALDSDADSDRSDSFKHTLSSSVAASGTHRSGMSFTAKSCHDSVRVVIPDSIADRDDPITAAIMRSAESYTETKSPDKAGLEGELAIIPRASSFTSGGTLSSPITPGRKESRKILRVAAAAAGIKIRVGSNSQLPPLSPSTSNDYKRATPSGPISPSLANSKSERKPSPLKDRFRSMAGAAAAGSLQSSAGAAVASAAVGKQGSPMRSQTLPPITKDRSRSRHVS